MPGVELRGSVSPFILMWYKSHIRQRDALQVSTVHIANAQARVVWVRGATLAYAAGLARVHETVRCWRLTAPEIARRVVDHFLQHEVYLGS